MDAVGSPAFLFTAILLVIKSQAGDINLESVTHAFLFPVNKVQQIDGKQVSLLSCPACFCTTVFCLEWGRRTT